MKRILLVALAACGNDSSRPIDAQMIDAKVDAPADALIDAPAASPNAHRYVVDHEILPANNTQARTNALDLNNDGQVDNQLGMVISTFIGMGLDAQAPLTGAIDRGNVIMLADLESSSLTTGTATFELMTGSNPMPAACTSVSDQVCRHHLAGTATFDVPTTPARDTPLAGSFVGGVLDVGPGTMHITTDLLGANVRLELVGARVRLTAPTDNQIMTGIVAGGVTTTERDTVLYPALQVALTAQIAADCNALTSPPTCGCTDGSTGKTFVGLFDASHDCHVTVDEISSSSLVTALFAPDITIGGQQAVSLGVGITAVHAAFVP